jgi:hypothetical protein
MTIELFDIVLLGAIFLIVLIWVGIEYKGDWRGYWERRKRRRQAMKEIKRRFRK